MLWKADVVIYLTQRADLPRLLPKTAGLALSPHLNTMHAELFIVSQINLPFSHFNAFTYLTPSGELDLVGHFLPAEF